MYSIIMYYVVITVCYLIEAISYQFKSLSIKLLMYVALHKYFVLLVEACIIWRCIGFKTRAHKNRKPILTRRARLRSTRLLDKLNN